MGHVVYLLVAISGIVAAEPTTTEYDTTLDNRGTDLHVYVPHLTCPTLTSLT